MTKPIDGEEFEKPSRKRPSRKAKDETNVEQAFKKAAEKANTVVVKDVENDTTAANAIAYDRDERFAEFFGFYRHDTVFSYSKKGDLISRKLAWPGEPEVFRVKRKQFTLPFDVSGIRGLPLIPPGMLVISGPTGSGKSTITKMMADRMPLKRLLAVEPHDDGWEVANLPTFSSADGALAFAVAGSYNDDNVLYCIDSLRAPLFETNGAAGAKGVIMPFFTQLTRVSNQLAMAGITIVVTINPMSDDPAYVETFKGYLSASCPAVLWIEGTEKIGSDRRWHGTLQMRPNRSARTFSVRASERPSDELLTKVTEIEFEPVSPAQGIARLPQALINRLMETTV